jgi:hypothetical protein
MAEIVTLKLGHPLVGTWRHSDPEHGTMVQFVISAAGAGFHVRATDRSDDEELSVSDVRWDGRVLGFTTTTPSTGHRVEYVVELVTPNEVAVAYTCREQWIRVRPNS